MQIDLLEYLKSAVFVPLAQVRDDLFRRMTATAFYAFLSAVAILITGLVVYAITLIPLFQPFLPLLLVFLIGVILAIRTVHFHSPSTGWTLAAGAIYFFLLLAAKAFFQLANYFGLWGYVIFLIVMTLVISIIYWFYTDFYVQMFGPERA